MNAKSAMGILVLVIPFIDESCCVGSWRGYSTRS